jgi:hypothetical protein
MFGTIIFEDLSNMEVQLGSPRQSRLCDGGVGVREAIHAMSSNVRYNEKSESFYGSPILQSAILKDRGNANAQRDFD